MSEFQFKGFDMYTREEIEREREALIRQWNRSSTNAPTRIKRNPRPVRTILGIVLGSFLIGSIPVIGAYAGQSTPTDNSTPPTHAGVWGVLAERD